MANIVITSTTNLIIFDVGSYSPALGFSKASRQKDSIQRVSLYTDRVEYAIDNNTSFALHYTTNSYGGLIVDSIDGVAPTSLSDLFDKINTILG